MKLIECVPNISEGRNRSAIDAVAAEVAAVEGVRLLHVDPGAGTNRTVITFVAPPEAAAEAAFRLIAKAAELIDMRLHTGEHPRNGATDVCPFVPLSGTTMEECVELAHSLGKRVAAELDIPVYYYGNAATRAERRRLADVRAGEYEALKDKLSRPEWRPDEGPVEFDERVARAGATQIGAREFLIAYNINLDTAEVSPARRIALAIRERGGAVRKDRDGKVVRGPDGAPLKETKGLFEHCNAKGWFIETYGIAQVTVNLTDYHVTPIHAVFDAVRRLADETGCRVTGSEIVGLVPLDALLAAGRHYLGEQGGGPSATETELVEAAIEGLGLSDVAPFVPGERIIEYRVAEPPGPMNEVSREASEPEGLS